MFGRLAVVLDSCASAMPEIEPANKPRKSAVVSRQVLIGFSKESDLIFFFFQDVARVKRLSSIAWFLFDPGGTIEDNRFTLGSARMSGGPQAAL